MVTSLLLFSADTPLMVGILVMVIGVSLGFLVDPARPVTYWVAAVSVALTGLLVVALAPTAVLSTALLTVGFAFTTHVRDRRWPASLIPQQHEPRTPPPPPPSTSANG